MELIGFYLLLILILLVIWRNRKRREKERVLIAFVQRKIDSIRSANDAFEKNLDVDTGYFTNSQLRYWKSLHENPYRELEGMADYTPILPQEDADLIRTFSNYFTNAESIRADFNNRFIAEELKNYSSFFGNIEGRRLDIQQRTAIVTDEDNNLVIAGAGSGKTTTIVGKVQYLLERYKPLPEEILLISFTKNSAETLASRINIKGVEAKTFHKLGKDIIVESEGRQPSIFEEAQFRPILEKYFKELIKQGDYFEKVTTYFTNFLKLVKSQFDFDNQGEYIQYIKDNNFRSYKLKELNINGKLTYRMEVVKSIEECRIANFLLFNGVHYEYEFPYEHDTATERYRQYKPDFTIIQGDRKIYLEHFGISRSGEVPKWFAADGNRSATDKYQEDMAWKRSIHKIRGTTLIETYSYEMEEEILFDNLKTRVQNSGIVLKPKSPEEMWKIISESASDEIDSFTMLIQTFITLMKSNNYSIDDTIKKNRETGVKYYKDRNLLFIEIVRPIYERYQSHLIARNEIDFSDMINKATELILNGRHKRQLRYVIIDEFQDISISRYQLVKAIKTTNPGCKFFCVGDDWQSIYRFSGSDIALFKDFESYFGYTARSKIETTYRFHEPLISLSSQFILRNPKQTKKKLKGISKTKRTEYKICYSMTEAQDDTLVLQSIFNELLLSVHDIEDREIIVLGRYGFDIERIKNENSVFRIDRARETISYSARLDKGDVKNIGARFMTVHRAKGLEGDIVIVLNCNAGKLGFPSEMSDDHVLDLLLSEADQFENGEERRLFYVAMTRAKEKVYFIANSVYKSKFITELEVENRQSPNKKCPKCKTSDVVLMKTGVAKNGTNYRFYGCTNYLYGCDYTKTEWIKS